VDDPIVSLDYVCEQAKEVAAVGVGAEDRCPVDSTRSDVVGAVGKDIARQPTHSDTVGPRFATACLDEPCL
jgi:hypothetical protein